MNNNSLEYKHKAKQKRVLYICTIAGTIIALIGLIIAVWKPIQDKTYTITFDANGGKGGNGFQLFTSGEFVTINGGEPTIDDATPPKTPNRTSYKFIAWNTASNGNGTSYYNGDIKSFSGNIVLFAQWEPVRYTVKFDANGGSNRNMQTTRYFVSGIMQKINTGEL